MILFTSLRKELEEMKRQLHEKSRITNKASPRLNPQDGFPTISQEEKTPVNGEYTSRIPGTVTAASDSPIEPELDDMQAANCVIS